MATTNEDNCIEHYRQQQKMKGQTKKCHTFSALLFNQLLSYMQCSQECFDFRYIMDQFPEASVFFLMWSHTAPNFQKVVFTKLFLAGESQFS